MESKKSDIVKTYTKLKPTAEEQDKTKQYKKPVAELLGSFSLSLFALALLNKSLDVSDVIVGWHKAIASGWYYLAYLGIIILIFSLYLMLPNHKAQRCLIRYISNTIILKVTKLLGWAIVLILLGEGLIKTIQSDWAAILGLLCIVVGIAFWIYGIYISIKEVQLMGSKGRKNTKKPKQDKKQEEKKK